MRYKVFYLKVIAELPNHARLNICSIKNNKLVNDSATTA